MSLQILFCLISCGLATVVQVLDRYQLAFKNHYCSWCTPTTFPLTGYVSSDTTNWYLRAWMYNRLVPNNEICFLSVSSNGSIKLCINASYVFQIRIADTPYTIAGATYESYQWFFIEIGSTNLGYYASVQKRNGTPVAFPQTLPPLTLKATSSIKYPDVVPSTYEVRAT